MLAMHLRNGLPLLTKVCISNLEISLWDRVSYRSETFLVQLYLYEGSTHLDSNLRLDSTDPRCIDVDRKLIHVIHSHLFHRIPISTLTLH